MKRIVTITLIFVSQFSFASKQNLDIINGHPALPGDKYNVHTVAVGSNNELSCSGVIVANNFVLTAAHCKDDLMENGQVFFGTSKANFVIRHVVAVTEHAEYCKNDCGTVSSIDDYDILVVQFDGDLPTGFKPVKFASRFTLNAGMSVHLAGFGLNEQGDYEDILKFTTVPFLQSHGATEFKTNENSAGSCQGDSGGPAFIEVDGVLLLAGITSRGDGPCRRVGIYTMVDYFTLWIYDIIMAEGLSL